MPLLYHAYVYLEFLILACTIYILAPVQFLKDWQAMKELLDNGSQTQDNYEIWKTIRPSVTKVTHE